MAKPNLSKALPAPEAVPDLAPFPIDVLPKGLRRYVREAAVSIGCPPDFLGLPMFVLAGMAIGNSRELEIKPGWTEGANLFAAIVGDPGAKKTAPLKALAEPFYDRQARLHRVWKAAQRRKKAARPKKQQGKKKTSKPVQREKP